MGCSYFCGRDKEPQPAHSNPYLVEEGEQSPEVDSLISDEQLAETYDEPEEVKEEDPPLLKSVQRDPKDIFAITFTTTPLGVVLTSAKNGSCAYVTEVYGEKNNAVKNNKLPIGSKVLKVNQTDLELKHIDDITETIIEGSKTLPMIMVFCHPNGLNDDEIPDSTPKLVSKK